MMRGLVTAVVAAWLLLAPFSGFAFTFKIATISPDGTSWMRALHKGADEIAARTSGRIRFRFYPGGIMGNDASVLRKIRIGQLHGGAITGGGLAAIYPDSQVYTLPLAFRSFAEVDFVRSRMDETIIKGIRNKGFVSFGLSEGGFAYVMADEPMRSVDDLKGQKVWVPEGDVISRSAIEAFNVSPISLPLTDVLTGLQTGLINTVATSPIGAIALQWHTRVKYLTDAPLMYVYGTLVVQRKAYERLSPEDQAIVQEVMGGVLERLNRQNRLDNEEALQALQKQGIEIVKISADQARRWQAITEEVRNRLVREGVMSEGILTTFQKHLHEFRRTRKGAR
ncbi:MAG: TRAP transporter substrate-binding protein DctP [Pseudomonadota bacterium]